MIREIVRITLFVVMIGVLFTSCGGSSFEGKIVAVEVKGEPGDSWEGSRLISIDPGSSGKSKLLSEDFERACAPSLSHEGRYLYFQGKREAGDPWQIWVMDLKRKSISQVTNLPEDCTHPVALPDGSLIFSRAGSVKETVISSLFKCQRDGGELNQLTFNPALDLNPSLLDEGRILYISSQQYPESGLAKMMIMRPDGTKSELYHQGSKESYPVTRAMESEDGHVYFITTNGKLSRVKHSRPLFTFENLSREIKGKFSAVCPKSGSLLLVSYQPSSTENFALYEFDPSSKDSPALIYSSDLNITQCLWIRARSERPRILPSAVNMEKETGLLMSQDINHSMLPAFPLVSGDTLARGIRVYDVNGLIGETEVQADGSFYLELDADTPVRVETINVQGETVRGPSDWIYLRPNERRACVGCHADQELAPKNFQPLAVKGPPVLISAKKEMRK